MALIDDWSTSFDERVRERGEDYARQRRVDLVDRFANDAGVAAVVRGAEDYRVSVEVGPNGDLWCECECPFFTDRQEPCKHVWATIVSWQRGRAGRAAAKRGRPKQPDWRDRLLDVRHRIESRRPVPANAVGPDEQYVYVIDTAAPNAQGRLAVHVMASRRKRDGGWTKPRAFVGDAVDPSGLHDPIDRELLSILAGANGAGPVIELDGRARVIPEALHRDLVRRMCDVGRALVCEDGENHRPLRFDGGAPWRFETDLIAQGDRVRLVGTLQRGDTSVPVRDAVMVTRGGLVFGRDWVAELDAVDAFEWLAYLRAHDGPEAPVDDADGLAGHLLSMPHPPPLEPPDSLVDPVAAPAQPRPHLVVRARQTEAQVPDTLIAMLTFEYGDHYAPAGDPGAAIYDESIGRLVRRDRAFEGAAVLMLGRLGFEPARPLPGERLDPANPPFTLPAKRLDRAVTELALAGWNVEAAGHVHRQPTAPVALRVSSGIDWFELQGEADFDGHTVTLPALLAAVRKGERLVTLDDGSVGMLPTEWLAQLAPIAELGVADGQLVRFRPTQTALIDALLAAQPGAEVDAAFAEARRKLREFEKVDAVDAPASFVGELRPYQREGLGWLHFCRDFGFGGCLADDMGLGKTVQVLALLDERRALRAHPDNGDRPPPSLAVVPRSLVHNWVAEAARFTPQLRVLDHTGPLRDKHGKVFDDYDLVVTTYGTLRSDAAMFAERRFDYAVLDEAQAIKNAATASAKAARLVRADHRLAMTGTPIENHLGELWSLFEFLNPGMLGRSRAFKRLTDGAGRSDPDDENATRRRQLLARAVAPFVLRRTKEQVAPDLPPRTEQTIDCPMEPEQQKLYDELRDHYRSTLMKRVAKSGLARSKVHVLEALLRLRQAACHPGLIDETRRGEPSAKLDTLLERLDEVVDEGHKALVFSQFTSLLSIVRDRLDGAGVPYEYLDGKTRDRAERIERFQEDPDTKLFLISLKAGGLGLNLTAADYVFLLDPWWNPAAEAQAIDRTHRIGQTRHVFAYRLITPDTVEQKVLELQQSKRDLADAIITADQGPLSGLTGEELEQLLS